MPPPWVEAPSVLIASLLRRRSTVRDDSKEASPPATRRRIAPRTPCRLGDADRNPRAARACRVTSPASRPPRADPRMEVDASDVACALLDLTACTAHVCCRALVGDRSCAGSAVRGTEPCAGPRRVPARGVCRLEACAGSRRVPARGVCTRRVRLEACPARGVSGPEACPGPRRVRARDVSGPEASARGVSGSRRVPARGVCWPEACAGLGRVPYVPGRGLCSIGRDGSERVRTGAPADRGANGGRMRIGACADRGVCGSGRVRIATCARSGRVLGRVIAWPRSDSCGEPRSTNQADKERASHTRLTALTPSRSHRTGISFPVPEGERQTLASRLGARDREWPYRSMFAAPRRSPGLE